MPRKAFWQERGIAAPLMVVRGDGALITAAFARTRPIETILSGPAASLVGARHMTGLDDAVVSDIGGTTTDIAVLDGGRLRLDPDGAIVGGYAHHGRGGGHAHLRARRRFGGGAARSLARPRRSSLGPAELVPLALAAMSHGEVVHKL